MYWSPKDMADAPAVYWQAPLVAGKQVGRFARAGTVVLGAFVVWLVAGRAMFASSGTRPPLLLVGWGVLRDTLELHGQASDAFRSALAVLWFAVPLWTMTAGFRSGPRWLVPARLVIGLAGLVAAVPLLVALSVVAFNIALWVMAVVAGLLLLVILLLRAMTAPFRRW